MSDSINKRFISHRDMFAMATELGIEVAESRFCPQLLVAVWRGGALPCNIVHEVLLRVGQHCASTIVTAQSYKGIADRDDDIRVEGMESLIQRCDGVQRVLLVDDIVDSGHTLRHLKHLLNQYCPHVEVRFATLFQRSGCEVAVDYVCAINDQWLVFPHELQGLSDAELLDHDHLDAEQHQRLLALIAK